jgi:hypothetical protein
VIALVCVRVVLDPPPPRCHTERRKENRYRVYRYASYLTQRGVSRWKLDIFRSDRGKEFLALHANRGLQSPAVEEAVVRLCEVCDLLRGARNALFEAAAAAENFVQVATGTFYVPATGEVCGVNRLPDEVQDALVALRDAVDNLLRERGKVIAGPGVRPPNIVGEMLSGAEGLGKEEPNGVR